MTSTADPLHGELAELAELVAFADGRIDDPVRHAAVAARVAASPKLAALVDEQRAVAALVRGAAVPAPPRLRARITKVMRGMGGG